MTREGGRKLVEVFKPGLTHCEQQSNGSCFNQLLAEHIQRTYGKLWQNPADSVFKATAQATLTDFLCVMLLLWL